MNKVKISDTEYTIGRAIFSLATLPYDSLREDFGDRSALFKVQPGNFKHREDGPAILNSTALPSMTDRYFLHGLEVSKEDWQRCMTAKKAYREKMLGYSGKEMNTFTDPQRSLNLTEEKPVENPGASSDECWLVGSAFPIGPGKPSTDAPLKNSSDTKDRVVEAVKKHLTEMFPEAPNFLIPPLPEDLASSVAEEINYDDYHKQIKENAEQFLAMHDHMKKAPKKPAAKKTMAKKPPTEKKSVIKKPSKKTKTNIPDRRFMENLVGLYGDEPPKESIHRLIDCLTDNSIITTDEHISQLKKISLWPKEDYVLMTECSSLLLDSKDLLLSGEIERLISNMSLLLDEANKQATSSQFARPSLEERVDEYLKKDELPVNKSAAKTDKAFSNFLGRTKKSEFAVERTPEETIIFVNNVPFSFNKKMSIEQKSALLDIAVDEGLSGTFLGDFNTPELTFDDVGYWIDSRSNHHEDDAPLPKEKKSVRLNYEIKKINRLIADGVIKAQELDKYVALGIISSAGLKAWRVEEQTKNNYFYGMELFEPVVDEMYDQKANSALNNLAFIPSRFEIEAKKAAIRVAGTQLNNLTRAAIIKALPDDKAEGMRDFLASELGSSFVSFFGGLSLTYAMENNATAQELAKELRIAGITTIGNEVVEGLIEGTAGLIKKAVEEIPIEETKTEISITDEEIEEELIHQETKNHQSLN